MEKISYPLFPSLVVSFSNFITEEERLELIKIIKGLDHTSHDALAGNSSSTYEKNYKKGNNFLDIEIEQRIQDALDEYVDKFGSFDLEISRIWSNIQNSGSVLLEHCHGDGVITGSLYINVGKESRIYFHNPNPHIYFKEKKKFTDYNYKWMSKSVQNCQLIIFPSWLKHGKNDVINTMDDRIVISFNAMPKDSHK